MRNVRAIILVAIHICLVVMLVVTMTIAKEDMPEEIVIDNPNYETDRKGSVYFFHLDHYDDYDVACEDCHHEYEGGENVWTEGDPVKKCASCHDPSKSKGHVKKLSIAFHKNCKACHENLYREDISEDAPFKNCYDCHEKKH
jgi:hypothetical protein